MIGLIQRVSQAAVRVDGRVVGEIGPGLLALVCAERGDTTAPTLQRDHGDTAVGSTLNTRPGAMMTFSGISAAASVSESATPGNAAHRYNELVGRVNTCAPSESSTCNAWPVAASSRCRRRTRCRS